MITNEYKELIENNAISFATVDLDLHPNVIWVAFVKVVSTDQVLITDNFMKQTKKNLEKNNNVCLAVWNSDWNWIKLIWKAEYFTKWKRKDYIKSMPDNKGMPTKWAILVTIDKIIGLS